MEQYFSLLQKIPLFQGILPEELPQMLGCLGARTAPYAKRQVILLEGQPVSSVGIVLTGRVQIVREDFTGNRNILAEAGPGSLFAEAFCFAKTENLPVTVISVADSEILWIDSRRMASPCSSACGFHAKLLENMLAVLARKNLLLNQKIEHLSKRTTREKLLSYLSDQAAWPGGREFDIPFNRQELADYLCVDRSAMSAELSRLQREGVLTFHLRHFKLNLPELS